MRTDLLREAPHEQSFCEWKGAASYFDVCAREEQAAEVAAWTYRQPNRGYRDLTDHYAFYAGRVDRCFLDQEPVIPQGGGFYGGWVTAEIVGPYKGQPGTEGP